jgi:hypothetical protein
MKVARQNIARSENRTFLRVGMNLALMKASAGNWLVLTMHRHSVSTFSTICQTSIVPSWGQCYHF